MTTTLADGLASMGTAAPQAPVRAPRRRSGAWRFAVLIVLGLYFVIPIAASVLFTVHDKGRGGITLERAVHLGCGRLHLADRMDQGRLDRRFTDREVLDSARGLDAVIGLGGDIQLPQWVALGAERHP